MNLWLNELVNDEIFEMLIKKHIDVLPKLLDVINDFMDVDLDTAMENAEKWLHVMEKLLNDIRYKQNRYHEYASLFVRATYWLIDGYFTQGKGTKDMEEYLRKKAEECGKDLLEYLAEIEGSESPVGSLVFNKKTKEEKYRRFKLIQKRLYDLWVFSQEDGFKYKHDLDWEGFVEWLRKYKELLPVLERQLEEHINTILTRK